MHLLQLNSKDFRRLCILKGIYPREPKNNKRPRGYDGTEIYYHKKDIDYLLADTIITKYRSIKAHSKKISRAKAQMNDDKVKMLKEMTPQYTLNHIVRERQPTFKDALEDLDDALTLINLFAVMPNVKGDYNINNELTEKAQNISNQFLSQCQEKKLVRKVFLSIKGIQINVCIQNTFILFIVPHKFARKLPDTVDYELMQTFLEFQITLLNHVMCRLFKVDNLNQPPQVDTEIMNNSSLPLYRAYKINSLLEEVDKSEIPQILNNKILLQDQVFYLSRETPYEVLTILIHSQGGQVSEDKKDPKLTHIITDRDIDIAQYKNIDIAQTQWIVDSCNFNLILPIAEQAPGKTLPPHVSPFKLNIKEKTEYLPDRVKRILELKGVSTEDINDKEYIQNQMLLEDDQEDEIEPNDFSNVRLEVKRDKKREEKYITSGSKTEQIGLQRLTQTNSIKKKHIQLFKEKRDKMKRLAKIKQRRVILNEGKGKEDNNENNDE